MQSLDLQLEEMPEFIFIYRHIFPLVNTSVTHTNADHMYVRVYKFVFSGWIWARGCSFVVLTRL